MKILRQSALTLGIFVLSGCAASLSRAADVDRTAPAFAERSPRYLIETSDVLEITFRFTPEFNQTVTVQPDGFIPLESAGDLKVAGLTVPEAKTAIVKQYSSILHEPVMTLVLKEFSKPYFLVGGEVSRPGKFDLRGDMTVTDAITMAGGFTPGAKQSEVILFRRVARETVEVHRIDVKRAFGKGKLSEDARLAPGDSVYVPQSFTGKLERFMNVSKLGLYFNPLPVNY